LQQAIRHRPMMIDDGGIADPIQRGHGGVVLPSRRARIKLGRVWGRLG
jgi:hypothetical protein